LEIWGRHYDKTHLVSWWAGRYSRRGLPLRGRGVYGPVLTHGPRVVAADAAGTEALVGALLEIWGRHYDKTREPPWRAGEKRHPPLVAAPPPLPKGKHVTGFSVVFDSLQHGYHRLTGFSGRLGSPTARLSPTHNILRVTAFLQNMFAGVTPVRWCDSSSLATPQAVGQ
jgi:hypothetical protein